MPRTHDTGDAAATQDKDKDMTRSLKKKRKAGSVRTHGANVLYDRRERMAER